MRVEVSFANGHQKAERVVNSKMAEAGLQVDAENELPAGYHLPLISEILTFQDKLKLNKYNPTNLSEMSSGVLRRVHGELQDKCRG